MLFILCETLLGIDTMYYSLCNNQRCYINQSPCRSKISFGEGRGISTGQKINSSTCILENNSIQSLFNKVFCFHILFS